MLHTSYQRGRRTMTLSNCSILSYLGGEERLCRSRVISCSFLALSGLIMSSWICLMVPSGDS
ncbi:hypothetical protein HanRHA438_Chr10g0432741 [Helianthus annuus]|nr:hypothetical protein HanRHA438_Chr10g0432741 [Helianthus annuus]